MSIIKSKWKNVNIEFNPETKELTLLDNKIPESGSENPKIINKKDKIKRSDIKSITFKKTPVILPKNSDALFKNFTKLESIKLTDADFQKVESMNELFTNTPSLTSITIENITNSYIEEIHQVIENSRHLKEININKVELTRLRKVKNLISPEKQLPIINIKEISTPELTEIDGIYYDTSLINPTIYNVNTDLLNQIPLNKLTIIKNGFFKEINIQGLKIPTYCNVADRSNIIKVRLPENTNITPLATDSVIEAVNINQMSNISDPSFLKGCITDEVINLEQFKQLNTDEILEFLKERYKKPKVSFLTQNTTTKIKAGKYKNTILNQKDFIKTIISNNIIFTDITLKELEPSILSLCQNNAKSYHKLNEKGLVREKYYILKYSALYNDEKTLARIQKRLTILEQLTKN